MTTFVDNTTLITAAFLNACAAVVEAAGPIAIATVTPAADTIAYYTGAAAASSTPLSAYGRTLIDDSNAAAARTTLGLGTAALNATGDFATAAQGAKADTAIQPANPAFTGTATFNTSLMAVRSTGSVSIGWNGEPVYTAAANRAYLSIKGYGTAINEGCGVMQFLSNANDVDAATAGVIDFCDVNNSSGNKRVAAIQVLLSGTTANNRGSRLSFITRSDGAGAPAERLRIDRDGNVGFKTTVTGTADNFRFGDGADTSWMRLYSSGTADLHPQIKLSRSGYSDWVIGVGGSARDTFHISYAPAADTEAALATARVIAIDNTKNVGVGATPQSTTKFMVSTNAGTPISTITSICQFSGTDGASANVIVDAYGNNSNIQFRRANGTSAAPTALAAADAIGQIACRGYQTTTSAYSTSSRATISWNAAEAWTSTAQGTFLAFSTTAALSVTQAERVRIVDAGQVFITTTNSTITVDANTPYLVCGPATTAPVSTGVATTAMFVGATGSSPRVYVEAYANAGLIAFRRINTSAAAPSSLAANDNIGAVQARGYSTTISGNQASMAFYAGEAWSDTSHLGTYMVFNTTPLASGTVAERVRIYPSGCVGITPVNSTISSTNQASLTVGPSTTAPQAPPTACALHLTGADSVSARALIDSYAAGSMITFRRADGTAASPTSLAANDLIGELGARGYQTTTGAYSTGPMATFDMYAAEAWTSTAQGTYITMSTATAGTTTLTERFRIADTGAITLSNKIASYNGVATVANGVAQIVAKSLLTAQTAAIAATTLYAVPAAGAGMYRVSFVASITTAASTSSGLGGLAATGFKVIFTNPTDSVVKTSAPNSQNNHTATTANATTTTISGTYLAYCKASTNLQYSFDYASVNAAEMAFDLTILVEYLGA